MSILLIIYFVIGVAFIYCSTLLEWKSKFEFYVKTMLIAIAWPICTLIYFLLLPFDAERRKRFNDIFNKW
jgi:hypothetical protein